MGSDWIMKESEYKDAQGRLPPSENFIIGASRSQISTREVCVGSHFTTSKCVTVMDTRLGRYMNWMSPTAF